MRAAVVVVAAALLAIAAARCPNSCSGHGDCGNYDRCTCWPNWQGYDCSERTCEYDIAWATDYRQNPHYYAECSGKGVCDRSTGLCACFDGYTGSACRRSVCPNDCSGHGKCRLIAELSNANSAQSPTGISPLLPTPGEAHQYGGWDGDKIQACVCDGGFFGPDCSQRYCPMGDDPLTTCTATGPAGTAMNVQMQQLTLSTTYDATSTVEQAVLFGAVGTRNFDGELVLHFTDSYGDVWTTNRIGEVESGTATDHFFNDADDAATLIQNALAGIPNFRIPSVTVSAEAAFVATATTMQQTWTITFDSDRNAGEQQLLSCDPLPLGCQTAGCYPKYQQPKTWPVYTPDALIAGSVPSYTAVILAADFGANHFSSEYADAPSGVIPPVWDHSFGGGTATAPVGWYWDTAAAWRTLITPDSIFDNSGLTVDQATVQITIYKVEQSAAGGWGNRAADVYTVYSVNWDTTLTGVGTAAIATTCDDLDVTCTDGYNFIPAGLYLTSPQSCFGTPASETGIGFNHVPIGNGLYANLGNAVGGLTEAGVSEAAYIRFDVATMRCSVSESQAADVGYENLECSGRGTCDHSTGTCACYEGHYGDHCSLQTILV